MISNSQGDKNNVINRKGDDFLQELKSQFERELDIRSTLDTKANNMITMSSAIATFVIALGTFLVSRIDNTGVYFIVSLFLLLVAIIFATIGIVFFIKSYSTRSYRYPIGH